MSNRAAGGTMITGDNVVPETTMPTTEPHRTPEELARLGADAFERRVRPTLRPEDDGKFVAIDVVAAEAEWEGSWRPILVSAVGDEVLVGMRLLAGHELRVAVVPGGSVEISPLP